MRGFQFTPLILFLMAIRPILDLQGKYEGEGLNAGGVVGLFVAGLLILEFLRSVKKLDFLFVLVLFSVVLVCSVMALNFVFSKQSEQALNSLVEFARFLVGFSALLLLPMVIYRSNPISEQSMIRYYKIFLAACTVPIAIAWLQYYGYYPYSFFEWSNGVEFGRPSGGYFHPSTLGRIMVFVVILTYLLESKGYLKPIIKNTVVTVAFLTTFVSTHRVSLFVLILVVLGFEVGLLLMRQRIRLKSFYSAILVAAGVCAFILISNPDEFIKGSFIEDRSEVMLSNLGSTDAGSGAFLRGRGALWQETLELMGSAPLYTKLAGMGYEVIEPHSDILRVYLVVGLLGVVSFCVIFIGLFFWMWSRIDSTGKLSLLVLYLYIVLYGVTLQPTAYPSFMWLFFISQVFILVFMRKNKKDINFARPFVRTAHSANAHIPQSSFGRS